MSRPPDPQSTSRQFWSRMLSRTSLSIGAILLIGLAGGAVWAWVWIQNQLAPLVAKNLQQTLGRPVELGEVQQVSLNQIRFGKTAIPATATDSDRVTAEAVRVSFSPLQLLLNRTLQLDVRLINPDVFVEQSPDGQWVTTTIKEGDPGFLKTDLRSIEFSNGQVVLLPAARPNLARSTVQFNDVDGSVQLFDQNQRIQYTVNGQISDSQISLAGVSRPAAEETNLIVQGQNLPVTAISRLVPLPVTLQSGVTTGRVAVQFLPDQPPELNGLASLQDVTAQIANIPQRFTNTTGQLQFQGNTIAFNNINTRYGQIPAQIGGNINTQKGYNLTGTVPSIAAAPVLKTLGVSSPVAIEGNLSANLQVQGALDSPVLAGTVNTVNNARIDRVAFNSIQSQFRLTTTGEPVIRFSNLRASPIAGGTVTGNGQVQLGQQRQITATVRADNVPGDTIAQLYNVAPELQIGEVDAIAQISGTVDRPNTSIQFQAPQALYPAIGRVVLADNRIRLQNGVFQVAGGTVQASGQVVNGQFQADVNADQVRLAQFSPALRGNLNADLQLSGRTDALQLANIQAQGQVRFSEGLAVIDAPLTAQVRWNGERIQVLQASAPGLNANGTVAVDVTGTTPQIQRLDLAVQAQDYALQELGLNLPQNVALRGRADFDGRVTGTVDAPSAIGDLRLQNLRVNQFAFEPVLNGTLNYQAGQQTQLQLSGTQDQVALTLNANNRPTSFLIQQDQAIARGRAVGETLLVDLQGVPVALLQQLLPNATTTDQQIAGLVSGNVAVDLTDYSAQGNVAIANPRLGRISGDAFRGRFRFEDGVATIAGGELQQGDTQIALDGNVQIGQDPAVDFNISFDQTNVQQLLQALNTFGLEDLTAGLQPTLGTATDLQTNPIVLSDNSLQTKLEQFNQVRSQLAQQRARQPSDPIPPLSTLQGTLSGTIAVSGSPQAGFDAEFDVAGQNWVWGRYKIPTVVAIGSYANGAVNFSPLRIDVNQSTLALTGQFGTDQATGQVQVRNLPIALLQPFLPQLPDQIDGTIAATATISGSFADPTAIGTVALDNARINNQPIQQASTSFQYNDARLAFSGNALLAEANPLQASGNIPLSLPFVTAQPESNQISLNVQTQDSGLSIVNLFTDQINWEGGQGQLNIDVAGTLNQPVINGSLNVQNAALRSQFLAQPLTNVTGNILFDGNRITVAGLQGQYNQNQITAQGVLPIFARASVENPLTVNLNDLNLNLAGLYQGGLSGTVRILGTAFSPTIGGNIELANGEIILNEILNRSSGQPAGTQLTDSIASSITNSTPSAIELPSNNQLNSQSNNQAQTPNLASRFPIRFDDLQVVVGRGVRVSQQPVFNFALAGDVTLNGTIANPRPVGTVRLERGQINLFTTQFVLERNAEQTIRFTPEQGLDPILDIQLTALVPEATGSIIPTPTRASEIQEVPETFGRLRTIRVQASVEGPASELSDNIQFTSSPSRSRAEILSLVGGTFVNAFGQGDATLGIATIAGSALFGNLQGTITRLGQTIGLDELRIYPTIVNSPTSDNSVLGLATEGTIDVTNNVSVSVAALLATDDPLRYGIVYRINDKLRVRGSTNLAGEDRVLVEFDSRF